MTKPPAVFATGDMVEVACQDEGFYGALYDARVVRSMPKLCRFTIEYDALLEDSKSLKKVRETVDAVHVRPRPPRIPLSSFEVGQIVDALHNDGWWAGEVLEVLEGGKRYKVSFPETKEELEFGMEEVRIHMDWIDGNWVLPQPQDSVETVFKKGTMVEVCSDDEGFRGAWFSAVVIGLNGKRFIVEYKNLRTDDNVELLRETVDSRHIRPIPPDAQVFGKFKLLEEVDAFYNDGWWVGVISKVLEGPKYMVYFKKPWNEEIEFGPGELRLHHEWIGGKWIRASQALDL